jgi:hypothetical protein
MLDWWVGSGHDARRRRLHTHEKNNRRCAFKDVTANSHLSGQGCTKLHGYDVNFGTREEKENAAHGTMSTPRATLARANAAAFRLHPPILA